MATQRFFETGGFSANPKTDPLRVDASRLCDLTVAELEEAFQCTSENELAGIEGRVHILHSLGEAIMNNHDAFPNAQRPSDFLDVIIRESHHIGDELSSPQYELEKFWDNIIVAGFSKIWLRNRGPCGDCWSLKIRSNEKIMVPFHKLSQWLTYSLLEVIEATINIHFVDTDQLTGLAEYRNGGFFFDLKVINLTDEGIKLVHGKIVPQDHQLIIEWRALTVILLDKLAEELRTRLNLTASQLPLAKILEAGTWKGGRELAMRLRPESGGAPPIMIQSDGTLF